MTNKTDPLFGLEKVPDQVLIKALRFELGMLKSEYQELLDSKKHPLADNTEHIRSMEGQVRNLKAKIEKLEDVGLKPELDRIKNENNKLKIENNTLRNELLKQLKNLNLNGKNKS